MSLMSILFLFVRGSNNFLLVSVAKPNGNSSVKATAIGFTANRRKLAWSSVAHKITSDFVVKWPARMSRPSSSETRYATAKISCFLGTKLESFLENIQILLGCEMPILQLRSSQSNFLWRQKSMPDMAIPFSFLSLSLLLLIMAIKLLFMHQQNVEYAKVEKLKYIQRTCSAKGGVARRPVSSINHP